MVLRQYGPTLYENFFKGYSIKFLGIHPKDTHPDWAKTDLSSLRELNTGSSTIAESLFVPFHARGIPVAQVYGSTETGPVSMYLRAEDAQRKVGSAGKPGGTVPRSSPMTRQPCRSLSSTSTDIRSSSG